MQNFLHRPTMVGNSLYHYLCLHITEKLPAGYKIFISTTEWCWLCCCVNTFYIKFRFCETFTVINSVNFKRSEICMLFQPIKLQIICILTIIVYLIEANKYIHTYTIQLFDTPGGPKKNAPKFQIFISHEPWLV